MGNLMCLESNYEGNDVRNDDNNKDNNTESNGGNKSGVIKDNRVIALSCILGSEGESLGE